MWAHNHTSMMAVWIHNDILIQRLWRKRHPNTISNWTCIFFSSRGGQSQAWVNPRGRISQIMRSEPIFIWVWPDKNDASQKWSDLHHVRNWQAIPSPLVAGRWLAAGSRNTNQWPDSTTRCNKMRYLPTCLAYEKVCLCIYIYIVEGTTEAQVA